jgi:hypothetical protein
MQKEIRVNFNVHILCNKILFLHVTSEIRFVRKASILIIIMYISYHIEIKSFITVNGGFLLIHYIIKFAHLYDRHIKMPW